MVKRKQLLSLLLVGVMSISTLLTGCGNTASKESSNSAESTQQSSQTVTNQASQESQTADPEDNTLTVAIFTHAEVTDYEDNYLTQYMEEKLGINLDFYLLPATKDEANTKISLMATSGEDLPDVLLTSTLSDEAIYNYGRNGLFLSLNEYINDPAVMPNYNSMPEDVMKVMTASSTQGDGSIYSVAKYLPAPWNMANERAWINKVWLEKLGLEVPKTTEELKEVLIAFRDEDPNGNGIKDEIPMYARIAGTDKDNSIVWLMNSFIFYNGNMANGGLSLNEDGTKVIAPFTDDRFKEGLAYVKDLYDEGLLTPSAFTDDSNQFKATLNADTNVVGFVNANSTGNWPGWNTGNPNFDQLTMIAPVEGPDGLSYAAYAEYTPTQNGFIFATTEKKDLALKFLDAFYEEQTDIVARYGEEGVDYTLDPEVPSTLRQWSVESGVVDSVKIATIPGSVVYASPNNKIWRDVQPGYRSMELIMSASDITATEYDPAYPGNWAWEFHYKNYVPNHPEYILPSLKYTEEETAKIQDALTTIPSYVMTAMSEFVTGARDIEKGWDTYLKELESMGLSTWLEIAQDSYERTLK